MDFKSKKLWAIVAGVVLVSAIGYMVYARMAAKPQQQAGVTSVTSYSLVEADTVVSHEFSGTIVAKDKVPVRARVTGYITEKYVSGGQRVEVGQALYKIDGRSYQASLLAAQASAAQASSAAQNANVDLKRYEALAAENAIARQTLDAQRSRYEQNEAAYHAQQAAVQIAQDNLSDTVVTAPFSGTLNMDTVDLGTFVTAGSTALVTIQSTDPVYVEFSVSENEYLAMMKKSKESGMDGLGDLSLRLSDGTMYEHKGKVVEVSKNLDGGVGKIVLKASFANPNQLLLPGMFATVVSSSEVVQKAKMVPTKSIVAVLDKNFVFVVGDDGKVRQIAVQKVATQGLWTLVSGDLKSGDHILVDGVAKVKAGVQVKESLLTKEQVEKSK